MLRLVVYCHGIAKPIAGRPMILETGLYGLVSVGEFEWIKQGDGV